jgi:hypothetical protein
MAQRRRHEEVDLVLFLPNDFQSVLQTVFQAVFVVFFLKLR